LLYDVVEGFVKAPSAGTAGTDSTLPDDLVNYLVADTLMVSLFFYGRFSRKEGKAR